LGGIYINNSQVPASSGQIPFGELNSLQIWGFTKTGAWAIRFNAANTNDWLILSPHLSGNANGIYKTDSLGGALKIIGGEVVDSTSGIGIYLYNNIGAYISNIDLSNNETAIQLDGAKNFSINSCAIEARGSSTTSNNIKVTVASGITSSGIISGCYFAGGNSPVNSINLATSSVNSITIEGNRFFNFSGTAIKNGGGSNWGFISHNETDTVGSLIDSQLNFTDSRQGILHIGGSSPTFTMRDTAGTKSLLVTTGSSLTKFQELASSNTILGLDLLNERVGIGNASPGYKLDVQDTTTTASVRGLSVLQSGAISGTGYAGYFTKTGASTTNIGLYAQASGATNNYAAIFENGSVGIGTVSPTAKLQIAGTADSIQLIVKGNSTQTSDIQSWQDSSGTVLSSIMSNGGLHLIPTTGNAITASGQPVVFDSPGLANAFSWSTGGLTILGNTGQGTVPLTIKAGASQTANLQNWQNSSGTSLVVVSATGSVGIGTTTPGNLLDVSGSSTSTASAMIRNTSTNAGIAGLGIQLGSTTLDTTSRFINFLDKNGVNIGKIQAANTTSVNYAANGTDFAEWFGKEKSGETFQPGDVVIAGTTKQSVTHTTTPYDTKILGIVSTHPAFTGGVEGADKVIVALTGQVPLNIDPNSPAINPGDPLTSSTTSGLTTKATKAGNIVAKAQESWTPGSGADKIMANVNVSWSDPNAVQPLNATSSATMTTMLDATILGKLEAQGAVTFKSDVTFNGKGLFMALAEFFDKVIFHGDVEFVKRPIYDDKDMAGYAKVAVGGSEVKIVFEKEYTNNPIINITPLGKYDIKYWVTDVTTKGFTIKISPTISEEAQFNWTAFSVKDAKVVSGTLSATPTPTPTPTPTSTPSPVMIPLGTPSATLAPSPSPSATPSATPTP